MNSPDAPDAFEALVRRCPPPADPPSPTEWGATETTLGFRLPGDYKRLCDTYGPDVNAIRAWAHANRYDVPPRGRLPAQVRAAWERGHPDG
ncbi:Lsr2 family DNA-binding protein [Streptomyces echinatus]|uniref:Lsr2 family DNA-binding protein n=1 Tax=Streptomyces echinatus TaxID=67293 RepID=UPI0037F5AC95